MTIRRGSGQQLIIIGFTGVLLAACGGGGSGGGSDNPPVTPPVGSTDAQAPTAKIFFPPAQSLTTADSITVTGSASDPEGNSISNVTVNGVNVDTADGFATWRATVTLQPGDNGITVATADDQGNNESSAASITIKNEVAVLNPNDIALDGDRALVVDSALRALIAVDLVSGQRSIISGDDNGLGDTFFEPGSVVLDTTSTNRAFVTDGSLVIAVDLATGDRTLFADIGTVKNGGTEALDIALDSVNSRLLLVDQVSDSNTAVNSVIAVDLQTGTPSDFSSTSAAGPALDSPVGIVVAGNRALLIDSAFDAPAVIAVDLVNGDRTTIASDAVGSCTLLGIPQGIALNSGDSSAQIIDLGSASSPPAIISLNLNSTACQIVSSGSTTPATGAGIDFNFPVAIATDGNRSLVVDSALATVLSVDLSSGNREALTDASVGDGIPFIGPFDIEYDSANDRALVTDNFSNAMFSVNLDNGARTIFSGGQTGSGVGFDFPLYLAIDETQAYTVNGDSGSVVSVNLANGNRAAFASEFGGNSPLGIALDSSDNTLYFSVIETDTNGDLTGSELFSLATGAATPTPLPRSGSPLQFAQNLAIDSSAGTAYVLDTVADQLRAVTLAGGATTDLGPITDTQPTGVAPFQDISLVGSESLIVDSSQSSVTAIDNGTRVRRIVSGVERGNGVALQNPTGIAFARSRNTILVVDRLSFAVIAIEPISGDRVIMSR